MLSRSLRVLVGMCAILVASSLDGKGSVGFAPNLPLRVAARCRSRGDICVRMQEADGTADRLAELLNKREKLVEEKTALLKKRKNALSTEIAKLERDIQATPKAESKGLEMDGVFAVEGGGEGGGTKTRRGFLNRIFTGVGISLLGIGLLSSLFGPGIERLAYLSFAGVFEEGVIILTRQVDKAVRERDYGTLVELTLEQGKLDSKLFQPMIFWTEGNAADDDTNFAMGLKEHTDDVAAALRALKEGALQKDALACEAALAKAKKGIVLYTRLVNTRVAVDLPPLSEIAD